MRWEERDGNERGSPCTAQSFSVPAADIAATGYDLSLNRYKEVEHEDIDYDPPEKIISELRAIEAEIAEGLTKLEEMVG